MTLDPKASPDARQQAVAGVAATLSQDRRPILLGPWRSELGFEVSYWLPFLARLAKAVPGFADRASIVTRGGLAPLYRDVAHQGYDLYALRSVTEVRRENLHDQQVLNQGRSIKQLQQTPWDDGVLEDAAESLGVRADYHVVHPSLLYWALAPYWEMSAGLKYLTSLADYRTLSMKDFAPVADLPPKYVAVKFYGRSTFPNQDPAVSQWVAQTVKTLTAQCPIVVLSSASDYDDHVNLGLAGPHVHQLPNVPPEENLLLQAVVLSRAAAFVGTYGGVAQLALTLGVPSCSVWRAFKDTSPAHLFLSQWMSQQTRVPFLTSSLDETAFWQQVLVGGLAKEPQMVLGKVQAA